MATVDSVLSIAAAEIGYYAPDDPLAGSKYGRWMTSVTGNSYYSGSSTSVPWCAMFVSWVFAQAGQVFPGMPTAACADILYGGQNAGLGVSVGSMTRGDIVIFDWQDGGIATDHIGIVESVGSGSFTTIEGNTSGNRVARRTRYTGSVLGVVRPNYTGGGTTTGGNGGTTTGGSIEVDGYWGTATTAALQRHYGVVVDGEVWHQWAPNVSANPALTSGWKCDETAQGSPLIRKLQEDLGTDVDGIFGGADIYALQRRCGTVADGVLWGPSPCVMEMQRRLNAGTW